MTDKKEEEGGGEVTSVTALSCGLFCGFRMNIVREDWSANIVSLSRAALVFTP